MPREDQGNQGSVVTFDYGSQSFKSSSKSSSKTSNNSSTVGEYLDSQLPTGTAVTPLETQTKEQKNAKQKKQKNDRYTLVGTVNINPAKGESYAGAKTGDCCNINGVGNYLSGKYLIKKREINLSTSGLSISFEVMKTDFKGEEVNG